MNDTNLTPEQEKKADHAYVRGFLDQAMIGLKQSPEAAKAFYKRAAAFQTAHFTKLASIATAIRAHLNAPTPSAK